MTTKTKKSHIRHKAGGVKEKLHQRPVQGTKNTTLPVFPMGTAVYTVATGFLTTTPVIDKIFGVTFSPLGGLEQFTAVKAFRPDGTAYGTEEWPFMRSLLKGEFVRDEEMHIVRDDGSVAITLVSSHRNKTNSGSLIIIIIKDLTGHRALVRTLRESEENARALLDSSPISGAIINTGGIILAANPTFADRRGMTQAEVVGRCIYDFNTPQAARWVRSRHKQAIRTGKPVRFEIDRGGRSYEVTAYPIPGETGHVTKLVIQGYDITDRKRMEEELRKARDELEARVRERTEEVQHAYHELLLEVEHRQEVEEHLRQAQKMEAIGTLAGGVAHDFNNMLAVILGNAELVLDEVSDGAEGPRYRIEQIMKASKRARELVKQILAFSRKSHAAKNVLNLGPLAKETAKLLRGSLPSTIDIKLDVQTKADTINADPSQIQQILMNLATNAADAMIERGGTLTIGLSGASFGEGDPRPDPDMRPGRYVLLTVRDTGTGIRKELRERIFDPFFTTKESGKGTGMGLAVVFGIVQNHGGVIAVESSLGKGSLFKVFLPAYEGAVKEREPVSRPLPRGTETVLVVDDEPSVVEVASATLSRLGYQVTTAGSGPEGWKKFKDDPHHFDLVITDQVMPRITGMKLAEKMLTVRNRLPIILFTGYSETVSPEKAKTGGITELLMKPVAKKELAETVRRVLDARDQKNQCSTEE